MVEVPRSEPARRGLRPVLLTIALAAGVAGLGSIHTRPMPPRDEAAALAPAAEPVVTADAVASESPSEAGPDAPIETLAMAPATTPAGGTAADVQASPEPEAPRSAEIAPRRVPLPVPRPPEFRTVEPRRATRAPREVRPPAPPAAPAEEPGFFEKLFGLHRAPALAYAALPNGGGLPAPQPRRLSPSPVPEGGGVAVYDITARRVTLPSGERLEAHSGLGDKMDDPDFVHLRMRGATPPGTYDLTEREALFHGVRAIRMTPVGGSAAIHGRDGILAHTYMLGPSGASNGCVSFKEYDRFLQAYLRGEIARLVVVTGRGQDVAPALAGRATGRLARLGDDG